LVEDVQLLTLEISSKRRLPFVAIAAANKLQPRTRSAKKI
jgi:hypothetical protein